MIADYMIKPTVGKKFQMLRDYVMNLSGKDHRVVQQECVGQDKHESNGSRDNDMTTENGDMSMNVGDTYINVYEDIDY